MVIDTSALLAILLQEPDAEPLARAILLAERRLVSAATLLETGIVIQARYGDAGAADLDLLVARLHLKVVAVTEEQARIGRQAYRRFGKGQGHTASLNYGDCFSYALAIATGEPLLSKGDDFPHTDVLLAAR